MENKKWTREESEQNKNKLLKELQQEPFNTSGENLELITKEMNQLINEEEERQKVMNKEQAKDALIELLFNQVADLTMMSKIELGDDVIEEIKRLKAIIDDKNN